VRVRVPPHEIPTDQHDRERARADARDVLAELARAPAADVADVVEPAWPGAPEPAIYRALGIEPEQTRAPAAVTPRD
jgi:hypothetical protein